MLESNLETRVVEHHDDRLQARLVVSRATLLIGWRRTVLQIDGRDANEKESQRAVEDPGLTLDPIVRWMRAVVYPDMVAPVIEASLTVDGKSLSWPIAFDQFIALPSAPDFENAWQQAVFDLNPSWSYAPAQDGRDPKGSSSTGTPATTSIGASPISSKKRKTTAAETSPTST
jgi:hypothetical protein